MDEAKYQYACSVAGCGKLFKTEGGRKQHTKVKHPRFLNMLPDFDLCKQELE
jgi:hypothetical protein